MKIASIKLETVNHTKSDPYKLSINCIDGLSISDPVVYRFNTENAPVEDWTGELEYECLNSGPTFADQWPEIKSLLEEQDYVIAFRAGDDFNTLDKTLSKRGLPYPSVYLVDTQNIARRTLPGLVNYQYLNICEELGIDTGELPHNLSYLSARILMGCMSVADMADMEPLLKYCKMEPGRMYSDGYNKGLLERIRYPERDPKAKDLVPDPGVSPDPDNFFYGKNVLFTGSFKSWRIDNKAICKQAICNIGGFPQDTLNSYTNVLVEGIQVSTRKIEGKHDMSGKQKKVREMKAKGQDIEIVSGNDFIEEAWRYLYKKE